MLEHAGPDKTSAYRKKQEQHIKRFLEKEAEMNRQQSAKNKNLVEMDALKGRARNKVSLQSSGKYLVHFLDCVFSGHSYESQEGGESLQEGAERLRHDDE